MLKPLRIVNCVRILIAYVLEYNKKTDFQPSSVPSSLGFLLSADYAQP